MPAGTTLQFQIITYEIVWMSHVDALIAGTTLRLSSGERIGQIRPPIADR